MKLAFLTLPPDERKLYIEQAALRSTATLLRTLHLMERVRLLRGSLWEPIGAARFDIVVAIFIILSGLSIWKPVQLHWLTALFGGYDVARYVHFFCMAAIVGFLVVHVLLALLVPKSLRAMVTGK